MVVEVGSIPLGATVREDGSHVSFRVWAPFPNEAEVLVKAAAPVGVTKPMDEMQAASQSATNFGDDENKGVASLKLERDGDTHCFFGLFSCDQWPLESLYKVRFTLPSGDQVDRCDPYARRLEDDEHKWCRLVDNRDSSFNSWRPREYALPSFEDYLIYELHVGSFTPQGTLVAAREKLEHIADLGFTCVELMPLAEFSSLTENWGYNPRLLMALQRAYGTPAEMKAFVSRAHELGMAVVVDVVLHHGAVGGNELWDYDGWELNANGGIYHENAPDTPWGRAFGFWKAEVRQMLLDSCLMWLREYRADGLRFDSANDLPSEVAQYLTWNIREAFPGRLLSAEVTPENPQALQELGFDSLWVHSGYFDAIQQHRALGRGSHGGSEYAAGWDLPRLRTVMQLHYGFWKPTHAIKYMLGSHDQVGCQHGGRHYADYKMIGGQHRYAADQFGGGRHDGMAVAAARLWYTANVAAACIPMVFMGSEWCQPGWWNADEHHRLDWDHAQDEAGQRFMTFMRDANALRKKYMSLRAGACRSLHEDRANGVMAVERVVDGESYARIVAVTNCSRKPFQHGDYGIWVHSGVFKQVFSSQSAAYGGWDGWKTNDEVSAHDGRIYISLPEQCTLIFEQIA